MASESRPKPGQPPKPNRSTRMPKPGQPPKPSGVNRNNQMGMMGAIRRRLGEQGPSQATYPDMGMMNGNPQDMVAQLQNMMGGQQGMMGIPHPSQMLGKNPNFDARFLSQLGGDQVPFENWLAYMGVNPNMK